MGGEHTHGHHIRPRRWLVAMVIGVVVFAVAAFVVKSVWLSDTETSVSADQILDQIRDDLGTTTSTSFVVPSTTAPVTTNPQVVEPADTTERPTTTTTPPPTTEPAPAAPALPDVGVYRYVTTGRESIDALGGTSHDYPAETALAVVPGGCGVTLRWTALAERWEQWELCLTPDGIVRGTDEQNYHEFYGTGELYVVTCDRPALLVPAGDPPAGPTQQRCERTLGGPWAPAWEALDADVREVEGQQVPVRHVRMTVDDTDDEWEHTTIDAWLALSGLPVEIVATSESLTGGTLAGDVRYDEQYTLQLVSLTPMR